MWKSLPILLITLVFVSAAPLSGQTALDTSFTYQGEFRLNNVVVNTPLDFQFTLYDAVTAGNVVGGSSLQTNVAISRGVFTVTLDFGVNAFDGDKRWLNIQVRPPGGGTFTTLAPRVELKSTPNAQYALKAGSSKDADALGGSQPTDFVRKGEAASITAGMIDPHSVTNTEIAFQTITGTKLADGSVALVDLGANSVDSSKIVDGSIATADLASLVITNDKIAFGTISGSKIGTGTIAAGNLGVNSVDSSKILDGSIAAADLAAGILDGGDADTLDGLNSTSFLRSDATDSFIGPRLLVRSSSTLEVDGELRLDGTVTMRDGGSIIVEGSPSSSMTIGGSDLSLNLDAASVQVLGDALVGGGLTVGGVINVGGALPGANINKIGTGGVVGILGDADDLMVTGHLEAESFVFRANDGIMYWPPIGSHWFRFSPSNGQFELTDRLALSNELRMGRLPAVDVDQNIFFHDAGSSDANYIGWDDEVLIDPGCTLVSRLDSGFRWNIADNTNSGWMFQNGGDVELALDQLGNLEIDGTLAQSGSCDVAEAFFADRDLEPGTLVRLDPSAPEFVLATDRARDPQLVGVVSTRPGLLLRGPGQESYVLHDQMKTASAEAAANPENPELAARVGELEATFDSLPRGNVPVALVGRVPCKVVGPVRAGEPLTSSDVPGHAMALDRPGPSIGLALEGSKGGGTVLVLIQPGHREPMAGVRLKREELRGESRAQERMIREATRRVLARLESSSRSVEDTLVAELGGSEPIVDPAVNPTGHPDTRTEAPIDRTVGTPPVLVLTREAWGDFDGDGLKDVLLLNPGAGNRLCRNVGDGTFHDVTAASGLASSSGTRKALWQDYDRDGRLDLLLVDVDGVATLHQGTGSGVFTDVTLALGVDFGQPIADVEWLDYDNDTLPDLRVELENGRLFLHHNLGQGTFERISLRGSSPVEPGSRSAR